MDPKKLCEKSNKIISVSEATKNDLINTYGIEARKIKRIYSGINKSHRPILDKEELLRTYFRHWKCPILQTPKNKNYFA